MRVRTCVWVSNIMEIDGVGGGYPADLLELASDVAMVSGVPRCELFSFVILFVLMFLLFM